VYRQTRATGIGSASLDASQQVTPLNEESDEEPVRIVIDDVSADD
jgi:hypothetical protein